jgi:hypothetical protein
MPSRTKTPIYPAECHNTTTYWAGRMVGRREVRCRGWYNGSQVLCDSCEAIAKVVYPQGWRAYPGDTCHHGKYVGGCGADLLCGACEGEAW